MSTRFLVVLAAAAVLNAEPCLAAGTPAETVKAAKGPVQLTLSLDRTTVKAGRSVWYKLELKNIGKKKMRVEGKLFSDPWAMHENCVSMQDIFLEVLKENGKPLTPQRGGGEVGFDYETKRLSPKDQSERDAFAASLAAKGLSEQERHAAMIRWDGAWAEREQTDELVDPAKQLWLSPGASTTTIAWAYRDTDEYADHAEDEAQVADYTQLWTYHLAKPGKYRIRAVYAHQHPKPSAESVKKYGDRLEPWWVTFKTPFIAFEVNP